MTTDTPARPIGRTDLPTRLVLAGMTEEDPGPLYTFTAAGPNWRLSADGVFVEALPTFDAMVDRAKAHLAGER